MIKYNDLLDPTRWSQSTSTCLGTSVAEDQRCT